MTVKELRTALEDFPEDMDVFMDERVTDFTYGLVNTVNSKEINFSEDPGSEPLSKQEVVIIREL